MSVLRGFIEIIVSVEHIMDAFLYLIFTKIGPHAGTGSRHGLPVSGIYKNAFNEGPLTTHVRLNRVNHASMIPKQTVAVFSLGDQRFTPGNLTVASHKSFAIHTQMPTDVVYLGLGDKGAPKPLAALSAIPADKQILRRNRLTAHGASPWLFSA